MNEMLTTDEALYIELRDACCWEPERVKRIPFKDSPVKTGGEFYLWCSCHHAGNQFLGSGEIPPLQDMPIITVRRSVYARGAIWIGKCPDCGRIVFSTPERKGEGK